MSCPFCMSSYLSGTSWRNDIILVLCISWLILNEKLVQIFRFVSKTLFVIFFFFAFSFYWCYTSTYFCCLFSWWGCWCSSNTLSVLNLEFVQQILRAYYCKFDYLLPFQKCKTWINVRACVHRRDVKKNCAKNLCECIKFLMPSFRVGVLRRMIVWENIALVLASLQLNFSVKLCVRWMQSEKKY